MDIGNDDDTPVLRVSYEPSARYSLTELGLQVLHQNEVWIPERMAPWRDGEAQDRFRTDARELAKARHAASQEGKVIPLFTRGDAG